MRLRASTHVDRAPAEAFALWEDLERSVEYSAASVERRKLTPGAIGVGTTYHAVDRWPGRTVAFTVTVTEHDRPRAMAAEWSEPMRGGWRATFEPRDRGTAVTFASVIELAGAMRFLTPALRWWAGRQMRRFMEDFREWAERQPRSGSLPVSPGARATTREHRT